LNRLLCLIIKEFQVILGTHGPGTMLILPVVLQTLIFPLPPPWK